MNGEYIIWGRVYVGGKRVSEMGKGRRKGKVGKD